MEERTERTICLEELRRRIARLEAPRQRTHDPPLQSGCEALDRLLPEGGFRCGTLVEWLSAGEGIGAGTLALLAAREACQTDAAPGLGWQLNCHPNDAPGAVSLGAVSPRLLAVLDPIELGWQLNCHPNSIGEFCPTAAVRLGIAPEQLLVIQPQDATDHDWAIDQVLRSPAVGAVLAWPAKIGARTFRRWQLAAEEGGSLGLLLRPAAARSEPSWADVRLLVEPQPAALRNRKRFDNVRPLRITLLRCRGAAAGRSVDVELDDETYRLHPLEQRRLQIAN